MSKPLLSIVIVLITVLPWIPNASAESDIKIYEFTRNDSLSFPGKRLVGHVIEEFSTKRQVIHCAYECLRSSRCRSFNYAAGTSYTCQLNDADHVDDGAGLVEEGNGTEIEYHQREAFSIDQEALGPCATDPCQNGGRCLDTMNHRLERTFFCICRDGWIGDHCESQMNQITWGEWEEWGVCSVTCETGWTTRRRHCRDDVTGETLPSTKCFGRDVEYQSCNLQACPRWNAWEDWSECSTADTCGRGVKQRVRTCANGGTAGVDRYCLGFTNETAPCQGIDCRGIVYVRNSINHGQGRIEIGDDVTGADLAVCADNWDHVKEDIVCKQIGFQGVGVGLNTTYDPSLLHEGTPIYELDCAGTETSIQQCRRSLVQGCSELAAMHCRVRGGWSLWNTWGDCSVTCENGTRTRTRDCTHPPPNHGGRPCPGEDLQYKPCTLPMCPRNGTWGEWGMWSGCDVTCDEGVRERFRSCDDDGPCYGTNVTFDICMEIQCDVNGTWSEWGMWSGCDVTCGEGVRERFRSCDDAGPCYGTNVTYDICTMDAQCAVDGVWTTWAPWSECDVTCANGTRFRTRTCTGPFYGGAECPGSDDDVEDCFPKMCPVDGIWNVWAAWSECSHTCGYGSRNRSRTCQGPFYGGLECPESPDDVETCNAFSCPVDGSWDLWSQWGECTTTCGGGTRLRSRDCNDPLHGGAGCGGPSNQTEACNEHMCPIDGVFTDWEAWGECTVTCANGTRTRQRTCYGPYYGGDDCDGAYNETEVCVTDECPVDGVWEAWQGWQACNVSCGGGTKLRIRACNGPYFGGLECDGPPEDRDECNTHECPVDGFWADWASWQTCNVTCGGGSQIRSRDCQQGQFGGSDCTGEDTDTQACNTSPCPVDGEWEAWVSWSECDRSCGGGVARRNRTCHQPQFGGTTCDGESDDSRECNMHECPVDGVWQEWSNWTDCSLTCGTGSQDRDRTCIGPFHGGADCDGNATDNRLCNEFPCPIDGIFNDWTAWSECSKTCGNGHMTRNRTCFGPYYGGAECEGDTYESVYCNPSNCPVHGVWKQWTAWSECSTSCENGTRYRNRTCEGPYAGGLNCSGDWGEVEGCFLKWCPVDGAWDVWSEWNDCPVSCSGGIQNRTRACIGPFHNGSECEGAGQEGQECNTRPCPVDGEWSWWSGWSACNVTCGGGISGRFRFCSEGLHGGSNCTGNSDEYKDCNEHECPIDGVWASWASWSSCSLTCGTGERTRERNCTGPFYGGAECEGTGNETEHCNTHECPEWGPWKVWSLCSESCGGGVQLRARVCLGHSDSTPDCEGNRQEVRACNEQSCIVDGVWEDWATWSSCNVTCGGGTRWRGRNCTGPFYDGAECPGANVSTSDCNTHECPIDCVWEAWSDWDVCSVTCGGGDQSRYRNTTGPFYGGAECPGPANETRECNTFECPIDGVVSEWSEFYSCDVTCGGGIQWRNRSCIGPFYGGANCTEPLDDSQECNTHNCPIDGVYVTWSAWEACDVTCGGGIQWRNRTCDGPYWGGAECEGPSTDNQTCNDFPCPVDGVWAAWTDWDVCSVTCGGSNHSRYRDCDGPFHGGANCDGPGLETRECGTLNCPVDGVFTDWSGWGECDVTCGGGLQWRNRSCDGPLYGGADCDGPRNSSKECNTHECPIDGVFLEWGEWGECTVTCGSGLRYRRRGCEGPFHGGAECGEPRQEDEECGTAACPIAGDWFEWSMWTLCTATCGGGTRYRNRTCDWESYGNLTTDCYGDADEYVDCHTFECTPLAIHCADWATRGLNQSCEAHVDPDGAGSLYDNVTVECDFDSEPGKAITVMHHNRENRTQVKGYEGAGEYQITLEYDVGWGEAITIVDSSAECAQFMRWDCLAAIIHNPFNPDMLTTYWMNRTEQVANYFGGASPGSGNCACGDTNSCYNTSLPCNCDENDETWRFDEGFVTNRAELPIHSFHAGDTGGMSEDGFQTLGPLLCSGVL